MTGHHYWTNSSVLSLAGSNNPINDIIQRTRNLVLSFIEKGGMPLPIDPFEIANFLNLQTVPSESVRDARTSFKNGKFIIEFNPNRPKNRIRYSVSHEIVHTLFPDCKNEIRNRATHTEMKSDDWQLEMLCNIGASEILMPIGSFPSLDSEKLSIDTLINLRKSYDVSFESLLLRFIKLTPHQCIVFSASRPNPEKSVYKIDYSIPSTSIGKSLPNGLILPPNSVISDCTAIGFTAKGEEKWNQESDFYKVEGMGIPAYPGQTYPRVMGFVRPSKQISSHVQKPNIVKGDATKPRGTGNKIIAFVVNDTTPRWGAGFALAIRKKWSFVQNNFVQWVDESPQNFKLGSVKNIDIDGDTSVVTLISQHGYGASNKPRIRYSDLQNCLGQLAKIAKEKSATVHMPMIGSGEAGGNWTIILEIIKETLSEKGIEVTIYQLPNQKQLNGQQQSLLFSE
jgi:Zn-dependent peptidase ImmA (M78 family)/O-acetyl-ADP-ribose deacetylase (regulator of RNase III)